MRTDLPQCEYVERRIFDDAIMHEYDRELALRQLVSFEPAKSLESATIQLAEGLIALDLVWDQFPSDEQNVAVLRDYRRLKRLMHSVFNFLRLQADEQLEQCWETPMGNPWTPAEEAVKRHRKVCADIEVERLARLSRNKRD